MGADLVHFEIVGDDADKLAEFYTKALGWMLDEPMEEFGGYRGIKTSDNENAVGGGLYKRTMPQQGNLNYYNSEDIEASVSMVKENGGQVAMEKMAVKGMGYFAVCIDPAGNPFGFWKTDETAE